MASLAASMDAEPPEQHAPSAPSVFVVTGGSHGIGFAACDALATRASPCVVIFIGQDMDRGQAAEAKLRRSHLQAQFFFVCVDVSDESCGELILQCLWKNCGSRSLISGLLNNAAMNDRESPIARVLAVNVDGVRALSATLLPHMRWEAVIVNMVNDACVLEASSGAARLALTAATDLSTFEEAREHCLVSWSERARTAQAKHDPCGWGDKTYTSSKMLLAALTRVQYADARFVEHKVTVVGADPGWCRTRMTEGKSAPLSAAEGADTPVWLLLEAIKLCSQAGDGKEVEPNFQRLASGIYFERTCYPWDRRYR